MRFTKRKWLALTLAAAMVVSTFSVQAADTETGTVQTSGRVGDAGCLEIPGTTSTFDEYNTSFLSVSGFAKGKVNDRTADYGTSKHRKVTTQDELFQAIRDAKLNTGTANEVSEGAVSIIEIMNDIKITSATSYKDIIQVSSLNAGYDNVQGSLVSEVIDIKLADIRGLTIFSQNGAKIIGGTLQLGVGGKPVNGCEDIVIRNLAFDGAWQWDNLGKHKENGWTYVKLSYCSGVWIDHCSFTVAGDGNIDLQSGSNGVTLSWCKFGVDPEEAKVEGNIIHSSVTQMEKKYQSALTNAKNRGKLTEEQIIELKDSYHKVVEKIEDAGYDLSDDKALSNLQKNDPDLYTEYTAVSKYFSFFGVNKGTMYADMRLGGATPEEIMEYAAYHSKVHLTGDGDRQFADYDITETNTVTKPAVGVADSTTVAVKENVEEATIGSYVTTTTETFVKDQVATVTTTSITFNKDSNERLQLSLGYNWYRNIAQRVPMVRTGVGHLYNCYIEDMDHYDILASNAAIRAYAAYRMSRCLDARDGASVGADTCVFYGINQPIVGSSIQGGDISNINGLWASLYATAVNHAVIVNSKITNSDGEEYTGSSWDNNGKNLFTEDYGYKYTEETLKKWTWDSSIVGIGDTPISEVSVNDMQNGDKWKKLPYIVPMYDASGAPITNSKGDPVYEPFVWEYDNEAELPYKYQLLELDDVQPVVTSQAGAGVVSFNKAANWLRTDYVKNDSMMEGTEVPPVSGGPINPVTPPPVDIPTNEPVETTPPAGTTDKPVVPATKPPVEITPGPVTPGPADPATMETVKLGDIDRNGSVELADAQLTLRAALLLAEIDDAQKIIGDVDGNGTIELADAQKVLRVALLLDVFKNPTVMVPKL